MFATGVLRFQIAFAVFGALSTVFGLILAWWWHTVPPPAVGAVWAEENRGRKEDLQPDKSEYNSGSEQISVGRGEA